MNNVEWDKCVGPGWKVLVDILVNLCKKEKVSIHQVKEKFGGLRFYADSTSDKVNSAIEAAEVLSYYICEECGKPGSLSNFGWIKTLCPEHMKNKE